MVLPPKSATESALSVATPIGWLKLAAVPVASGAAEDAGRPASVVTTPSGVIFADRCR